MKAILVIDKPDSCAECPLMLWDSLSEYYGACCPTLKEENCIADSYKENEDRGTVPSWCPLKPMPERKEVHYTDPLFGEVENLTNIGYNRCLKDIEGEE